MLQDPHKKELTWEGKSEAKRVSRFSATCFFSSWECFRFLPSFSLCNLANARIKQKRSIIRDKRNTRTTPAHTHTHAKKENTHDVMKNSGFIEKSKSFCHMGSLRELQIDRLRRETGILSKKKNKYRRCRLTQTARTISSHMKVYRCKVNGLSQFSPYVFFSLPTFTPLHVM